MLSAVVAAHSLLSDDLKNLMKIEYLLMWFFSFNI
jgi:hypothetical protein